VRQVLFELIDVAASSNQGLGHETRMFGVIGHHAASEHQMMTVSVREQARGAACAQPLERQTQGVTHRGTEERADDCALVHASVLSD
jgi:hypothetical protein